MENRAQADRLAPMAARARALVEAADPLAAALAGGPAGLPISDPGREAAAVTGMEALAAELESLGSQADRARELDRLALLIGLRRAGASARPLDPSGAEVLERHLLLRMSRIAVAHPGAADSLAALLESAPAFLLGCRAAADPRVGPGAGRLALAAARRIPAVLDACAGAVATGDCPREVRFRVEAGLGPVLQASAEEAGWLLKIFLPVAGEAPRPRIVDPGWAGLGMSLEGVEAEAEAMLADAVASAAPGDAPMAGGDAAGAGPASLDDVVVAWDAAARRARERWGLVALPPPRFVPTPGWIRPLVPPLALVPGRLSGGDTAVVLCGEAPRSGLEHAVSALHDAEHLPAALAQPHSDRALLPAPELREGWRAVVLADDPTWPAELAWRASLTLAALAMTAGRASVDDAAAMIAAESGLDGEGAALQAEEVARWPLGALTFVAGARLLREARHRLGDRGAAALLGEGPLPAAALGLLVGGAPL